MLKEIRCHTSFQLCLGVLTGIVFGFLLHKGGATRYDVIIGQLLLTDFTVVKIMLSAVVTGMIGVHALKSMGLVRLHVKPGSFGSSVIGGLIFGVGFGMLGYCPGTVAGAIGQGSLDALFGGFVGILTGAWLFAAMYPRLTRILNKGYFGETTLPELLRVNAWTIIVPLSAAITTLLFWMQKSGL